MSEMLFDTSPEEVVGKKKRSKAASVEQPEPTVSHAPREYPSEAHFLATIDKKVTCPYCGFDRVDLVEERFASDKKQWLVQCGWNCLLSWLIDPIPGILETEDKKQVASKKAFVVKGGLFDGKTFDEIAASGGRWYITGVAEKGRTYLAAAAKDWLSQNGG